MRFKLTYTPAFVGLAIALAACVGLKPNDQASSPLGNDGGRDGPPGASGSGGGVVDGGSGGKAGGGAGGAGNAGASGGGGSADAGDADPLDASDASDDFSPDAADASDTADASSVDEASDAGDASDVPESEPCVDTCDRQATMGCSATGIVQACLPSGGCLAWHDVGPCPKEHLCCSGVCVRDDGVVSATCSDPAPVGYDIYVNASAVEGDAASADGSRARPFKTITRALRAVGSDGGPSGARIYVSRGRYDANLGEEFPLVVPGGVTLDGAGAARTTIAGLRLFNLKARGAEQEYEFYFTLVVGDKVAPTRIAGFTIVPGDSVPLLDSSGILCDRGSPTGTDAGASDPNTILSDLVIGPGYEHGIRVSQFEPNTAPCHLRVRASTFTGGRYGIYSAGFDMNMELGDGTAAGGNTFTLERSDWGGGYGVLHLGNGRFDASYNTFTLTNDGIYLGAGGPFDGPSAGLPHLMRAKINHNKFDRLDHRGLALWGGWLDGILVEEFLDNEFTNITMNRLPSYRGVGTALELHGFDPSFPFVEKARRNRFYHCDRAIQFSTGTVTNASPLGDFGSASDPGNNTFHCNGPYAKNGGLTSVLFDFTQVPTPVRFEFFQGNFWDTTTPNPATITNIYNGPWPSNEALRLNDNFTFNYAGAKLATPGGFDDCP